MIRCGHVRLAAMCDERGPTYAGAEDPSSLAARDQGVIWIRIRHLLHSENDLDAAIVADRKVRQSRQAPTHTTSVRI